MRALALFSAAALAGCSTTDTAPPDDVIEVAPEGECDATGVQQYVGQRTTAALGATIQTETKSRSFRWIPPRTVVTQDYRPDRVNVVYDDDYVIERIYCG